MTLEYALKLGFIILVFVVSFVGIYVSRIRNDEYKDGMRENPVHFKAASFREARSIYGMEAAESAAFFSTIYLIIAVFITAAAWGID